MKDDCANKTNEQLEGMVPHIRLRKTCKTNEKVRLTLHVAEGTHMRMVLAVIQRSGGEVKAGRAPRGVMERELSKWINR